MRFCHRPGCRELVRSGYCRRHAPDRDDRRPQPHVRAWYYSKPWRELRQRILARHPLCPGRGDGVPCGQPTTDVDHRVPHRGDAGKFWDPLNLDAYCHACHSAKTGKGA